MSLSERFDRDVAPKSRERAEYLVVFAACFAVLVIEGALQRIGAAVTGHHPGPLGAVISEARGKAANCATSSFMGM